jgi:hypothetical protein
MTMLLGSVPGAQSRLAGGLAMSAGLLVSDVTPTALQVVRPTLSPTQPFPTIGRFRRHITNLTTNALNLALGAATVLLYDWTTKLLVASVVSDANGLFDFPVYIEGTTFFIYANKAGSPEVYGGSSNQLVGL